MKTFLSAFTLLTFFITAPVWAEYPGHDHEGVSQEKTVSGMENAACEDTIDIKVNGLVCDFCARALEKVFGKRDEVSGIDVDLDNALVKVALELGQTIDDETLTRLINDSGYNVTAIDKGC